MAALVAACPALDAGAISPSCALTVALNAARYPRSSRGQAPQRGAGVTGTPGLIDPSEHALEQRSFKDSAVGAEDKLSLFAPFDDQRLSTLMARSGFLASQ